MNSQEFDPLRTSVLLSVQRALWGEVPPTLRAVTVGVQPHSIHIICYLDGEISEEDRDSMECVHTEVCADFPDKPITFEIHRQDAPQAMKILEDWVYLRRENPLKPNWGFSETTQQASGSTKKECSKASG